MKDEQVILAMEASRAVREFASHIDVLRNLHENNMLKENEKYKSDFELFSAAYYGSIYYEDRDIKIKAIRLLGIQDEDWLPEIDRELIDKQ